MRVCVAARECSTRCESAPHGAAASSSRGRAAPAPAHQPLSRRHLLGGVGGVGAALLLPAWRAEAVQGLTPGRIPGLSKELDAEGFSLYSRPEGKSGGHGIGWSEIPPYSFRAAYGWDEARSPRVATPAAAYLDSAFRLPLACHCA